MLFFTKLNIIFYGTKEKVDFKYTSKTGSTRFVTDYYEGVVNLLQRRYIETTASWVREWLSNYMVESTCEKCKGTRLKKEILSGAVVIMHASLKSFSRIWIYQN